MKGNSYAEINLQTICNNLHSIERALGKGTTVIPVLKSNAYGHGAVQVAIALTNSGKIDTIAVAQVGEAAELQTHGIQCNLLILSGIPVHLISEAVQKGFVCTLHSRESALQIAAEAKRQNKSVKVHIKIETGLNRLGVRPGEQLEELISLIKEEPLLVVDGMFTHLIEGEVADSPISKAQYTRYCEALKQAHSAGIQPRLMHVCNSGGSDWYFDAVCNAVRVGRRLYMDSQNTPREQGAAGAISETDSWRSWITALRTVEAGEAMGYNSAYTSPTKAQIALVCAGYADGLYKPLTEAKPPVLVCGKRGRLVAMCMDQCFVDVTGINCEVGDEITFYGHDRQGNFLSAQEIGAMIGFEAVFLTNCWTPRTERIYIEK